MSAWAMQLRSEELESLGALWHVPGIEALHDAGQTWLRGPEADDVTRQLLTCLPCVGRYDVLATGELRLVGHRVPKGFLPTGTWQPLKQFLTVSLPVPSFAARHHSRIPVRLVPSSETREPNILITDLKSWAAYSQTAPQVRLRHCQFAVAGDGRVLIQGAPLPPLDGIRAVARSGLVVPCGWTWSPEVEAPILAQAWNVPPGDLWLLLLDQPMEQVPANQLVAATRSAIQHTWEAFQRDRAE